MENLNELSSLPGDIQAPLDPGAITLNDIPDFDSAPKLEEIPDFESPLFTNYKESIQHNPDEIAKINKYSRALDENPVFVQRHLSDAEKIVNSPDSSYWREFEKRYPGSASFLSDQKNMAMAHDDHENISKTEEQIQNASFIDQLSRAWDKGVLSSFQSSAGYLPAMYDAAKSLNHAYIGSDDVERLLTASKRANGIDKLKEFNNQISALDKKLPSVNPEILNKVREGDYTGAAKGMALALVQNAPNQVQNILMAASGVGTPGLVMTGLQQAGSTWNETEGTKASAGARAINAAGAGLIESAFESLGTFGLFNSWEKELAKEVGKEGAKKISSQVIKLLAAQSLGEGNEEFWTSVGQDVLAGYLTGVDPTKKEGILERAGESFAVGFGSGFGMTSPSAFIQANVKINEAKKAQQMSKAYSEIGQSLNESKLKQRDSETHESLIESQTKGTAMENVYVSAEKVAEYFQSKNIDPKAIAEKLGVSEQFDEAIESGSDLKIPFSKWQANLDQESYQALKEDVKFDENSLSPKQIKEHNNEIAENIRIIDEQASKIMSESAEAKNAYSSIHDDIYSQLINTGMKENVAKSSAKIAAFSMITQAHNAQQDPIDFYNDQKLRIVSGETSVKYERNPIQKFESKDIVSDSEIKKAITDLALPEIYGHEESISAIKQALYIMKSEIDQAEAGQRSSAKIVNPEDGQGYTKTVNTSTESTFPAWFRENFKTKKDFQKVISKGNSKLLAPLVAQAIKALKEGHGENPAFAISPNLDFVSLVDPGSIDRSFEVAQSMGQGGKTLGQSKKINEVQIAKISKENIANPYSKENLKRIASSVRSHELSEGVSISRQSVEKTESELRKFQREEYAKKMGFSSSKEAIEVQAAIIKNLAEVFSTSIELSTAEDRKGRGLEWSYRYSLVEVDGKEYLAKFRLKDNGNGKTYYYENTIGNDGAKGVISKALASENVGSDSARSTTPQLSIDDFKKIINEGSAGYKYWQSNQADIKRGSVTFGKEQTVIRLFKDADASTFMHEMGHVFLEGLFTRVMSGDGTQKEMNQWKSVSEWLGYNPENQDGLTEDQHEQFARGFEAYLREGKAPTKELTGAFRTFRKWLTKLYKTATSLNVEINDSIRDVFNSMLVSDQAINQARAESGILLSDIEQSLGEEITDKVKEKLSELKEQAEDLAFERLFKEQLKLQGQEYKDLLTEKRQALIRRYSSEVKNSDEARAIEAQKEMLKVKDLKAYASKILNGKLSVDQLNDAEIYAELMGFTSADHMAKEMIAQKSIDQLVNERVEQEMQEFQKEQNPDSLKEQAIKKIRNEKSIELLAMEKEILFKMAEKENTKELDRIAEAMEKDNAKLLQDWLIAKEVNKVSRKYNEKLSQQKNRFETEISRLQERSQEREQKQKQRELVRRWLEAKDESEKRKAQAEFRESVARLEKTITGYSSNEADRVKEQARAILHKKPYKEAGSFSRYFTAERNASLRLAKAIKASDWKAALQAKHEQMLNHALARESIRISRQVQKTEKFLNNMRKLRRDLWKHEDHWSQASKILERFGYTRSDFDPDFAGMSLNDYVAAYTDKGFAFNLPGFVMDESIRIDPSAMNYEQLIDLKNAIKNIRAVANAENTLFAIEDQANIDLIKQGLLTASIQNVSQGNRFKPEIYESKMTKASLKMSKFFNSIKTVETLLAPLDGFKDKGKWAAVFIKSVYYAANDESKMIHDLQKKQEDLYSIYSKKELKEFKNKKVFVSQLNASLTKETLVSMALNLGNEANKDKLFSSPGVGFDAKSWNEFNIMSALQENLTERDWKFVQDTWDLIDSYWSDIRKLHVEMTGFAPGKVQASPLSVMVGDKKIDLKGGYYPLKQDARSSYEAESREIADTPLYSEKNPSWQAATKTGHTKQRTEAKYPIKLELGVVNEHLFNVIHDLAFRPTITDLRRILTDRDVQKEMRSALGPTSYEMVVQYLGSVAGRDPDTVAPGDSLTSVVRFLRKSTTAYMLAINVKNILQNFSNVFIYAGAAENFTQKDVARAMIKSIPMQFDSILKGKNELEEFVFEKSAFMKDRSENPEFTLKELADKNFGENSKLAEWSQNLMAFTDNATALPVWAEAYHKQIAEGASERDAVEYADTIMRRSIGSGRRYDQASLYRSGELVKIFTMFSSFMNVQYNRWVRETNQVLTEKDMLKYSAFAASQVIFVLSGLALMGKLPGDDEDESKWALRELTNYGMGLVPIVRDMGPLIMDRIVWEKPANYRASPVFEFFNTTYMAVDAVASDSKSTQDKIEAAVKVPMMATGTPMQFTAWLFNAADIANGMQPRVSDILKRRPKKER